MVVLIDVLTLGISLFLCLKNIKRITDSSRYIIYALFLLFYVFPLALDYVYMTPVYSGNYYYGFRVSSADDATRLVYDAFLVFSQIIILRYKKSVKNGEKDYLKDCYETKLNSIGVLLYIGMIFPIILTLLLPVNKGILFTYQWREAGLFEVSKYTGFIEKFAYIGICASLMIVFDRSKRKPFAVVIAAICAFSSICIQGKRSSIFFTLLVFLILEIPGITGTIMSKKEKKRKTLVLVFTSLGVVVFLILSTILIKVSSRGYIAGDIDSLYTSIRVDFFRDDRVRMSLYSMFHPEKMKILNYPGQSLLPIITWFFPIDYVLTRFGISFASFSHYLSYALNGAPQLLESAYMTPSIAAELIANFSILGIVLFPFICVGFSKWADKYPYPFNALILLSFVVLQMYAITYVAYFLEFVVLMCWYLRSRVILVLRRK